MHRRHAIRGVDQRAARLIHQRQQVVVDLHTTDHCVLHPPEREDMWEDKVILRLTPSTLLYRAVHIAQLRRPTHAALQVRLVGLLRGRIQHDVIARVVHTPRDLHLVLTPNPLPNHARELLLGDLSLHLLQQREQRGVEDDVAVHIPVELRGEGVRGLLEEVANQRHVVRVGAIELVHVHAVLLAEANDDRRVREHEALEGEVRLEEGEHQNVVRHVVWNRFLRVTMSQYTHLRRLRRREQEEEDGLLVVEVACEGVCYGRQRRAFQGSEGFGGNDPSFGKRVLFERVPARSCLLLCSRK